MAAARAIAAEARETAAKAAEAEADAMAGVAVDVAAAVARAQPPRMRHRTAHTAARCAVGCRGLSRPWHCKSRLSGSDPSTARADSLAAAVAVVAVQAEPVA